MSENAGASPAVTAISTPAQAFGEDGARSVAARWISEIELSERFQKDWHDRCKKIIARYKEERPQSNADKRRFAVLWSNQETLRPAVYAKPPIAVVLRRYKDEDPVGLKASEVLERALNFSIDAYDFDGMMKSCRDEYLLLARGQTRVRYVPTIEARGQPRQPKEEETEEQSSQGDGAVTNNTDMYEEVTYEEVVCDHLNYQDFGTNAARTWAEVRMVWFRAFMTREELEKRFGKEIGGKVPLDYKPDGDRNDNENAQQFAKACIYEVWDKISRKVFWVSKSYASAVLDERDDPLSLKDFFPCPKPITGTVGPDSVIPVPDYVFFQDQAEEVDDLTMRIALLTDALRMVGFYAAEESVDLQNVFMKTSENKLIPIEGWQGFTDKGGVKGIIEWVPVDMVITVLTGMFETRKRLLDDIYQITGISDIMRGDTDANETAAAQEMKSAWGSSRVREKQKEVARFARDAMRIKAEVIAGKFSIDTLKAMTNVQMLTNSEKLQIQGQMQAYQQQVQVMQMQAQAQAGGAQQMPGMGGAPQGSPQPQPQQQPPPPPVPEDRLKLMEQPSWEDVDTLLKNEGLRMFRIDVETDSTVEPNQTRDRKDAVEFLTAIGQMIGASLPVVQAAPPMGKLVAASVKFLARKFSAGRELEDTIDSVMDEIVAMAPQPPPDQKGKSPEEIKVEAQKVQVDAQDSQMDHQARMVEAQVEQSRSQSDEKIALIDAAAATNAARLQSEMRNSNPLGPLQKKPGG